MLKDAIIIHRSNTSGSILGLSGIFFYNSVPCRLRFEERNEGLSRFAGAAVDEVSSVGNNKSSGRKCMCA